MHPRNYSIDEILSSSWDRKLARDLAEEIEACTGERRATVDEMRRFLALKGYRELLQRLRAAREGKRGSKALHISTAAGGTQNYGYITEKKSFPATNNTLYGRMFVWFEDALTTDGHFTLAEGAGTGNAAMIRFGGQNKFLGVGTDAGASGDWTDKDNKPIPTKTWICTEFEFKGDTHEFSVWWDDMERPALHRGPSNGHSGFVMPQFNSLWFGWWMYNMAEPQELWIDEIAVDFKPIGCTK
jgi:hypothetical protein